MYALRDVRDLDLPYVDVNRVVGYSDTAVPQDFRVLDEAKSAALADFLMTTIDTVAVSPEEYEQVISGPDGELEREALRRARVEQQYLRQRLFGRRAQATCDICGRELPVDLLVAAHIKRRADCTRTEKLDVANIVMAACRLGCDELYERGYISVTDGGVLIATSRAVPAALGDVLQSIEGRRCTAHRPETSAYFAAQRSAAFRS